MLAEKTYISPKITDFQMETLKSLPIQIEVIPEGEIDLLAACFSSSTPWADRQAAAVKLGQSQHPEALPILLSALQNDPFWMVRCTIIQALETIGDAYAIPTLQDVAAHDDFSAVRSAAGNAIKRLAT